MTDEQFKTWAVDFFDRIEMIHSWREAAAEAIKMIETERAKRKEAEQQLMSLAQEGLSIFDQKEAEAQVVFKECIKLEKELEVERAKNATLVEALEYYAKGAKQTVEDGLVAEVDNQIKTVSYFSNEKHNDLGTKAREALAKFQNKGAV